MENRNAIDWWKKVVLENYANFEGRARRSEYWWFTLVNAGISFVLGLIFGGIAAAAEAPMVAGLSYIYSLAVLVPSIAVGVRRLHDVGKSGWYMLIGLIPFGIFYVLYLYFQDSQPGTNEYGPNPKTGGDFDIDKIGA